MLKKILALLTVAALAVGIGGCGGDSGGGQNSASGQKLVIYTSMKEALIGGIIEGFKRQNPGVEIDYQSAGAGKIMAKLAAERQSGHLLADIIWTSEVPDFYQMKEEGLLAEYRPEAFKDALNPFPPAGKLSRPTRRTRTNSVSPTPRFPARLL